MRKFSFFEKVPEKNKVISIFSTHAAKREIKGKGELMGRTLCFLALFAMIDFLRIFGVDCED